MTFHRYFSLSLIALISVPLCSMEQHLLQLYPVESTTENILLPNNSSDINNQKLNDVCMQTQQLIQAQSLKKSPSATPITKPTPAIPKPQGRSWGITRLWNTLYDDTAVALSYCKPGQNLNKSTAYITQMLHHLEWGIENA